MTNKPPDRVAVTMQINATEADIERWQRKAAEGGFASIQDYLASIFTQMCEDVGDGSEVLAVRVKNDEGIQGTWVKQPAMSEAFLMSFLVVDVEVSLERAAMALNA